MATKKRFDEVMYQSPLERAAAYYTWAYDHHVSDPELASEFEQIADSLVFLSHP